MIARYLSLLPLFISGWCQAAPVCDLTLTACPKQLPAGGITVPLDVISLDARIPYCQETGIVTTPVKTSIVFIIDNSGSMSMGFDFDDAQENDPQEARFTVVSGLLDMIAASHPGTEVGLVAFSRRLQFDHRDNSLFKTAFPNDTSQHDSYVPLIALNHVFADGRTGLDTLKALLKHNADGDMLYATTRPSSRDNTTALVQTTGGPLFSMRPGTDITLGFAAAKLAMLDSKATKEQQYFIFLSDGEPGGLDVGRTQFEDEFELGTGTPTTFTVYFTGGGQVPTTIRTMTTNIQGNAYSTSNANSAYFSVSAPATELQGVLQNSVISRILTTVPTQGKSVVVSANGAVQTSSTRSDSAHFLISNRMPLGAATTNLQFSYTHTFLDNSQTPPANKDTLINYTLSVQRSADAPPLPAFITKTCREQAALELWSGGQALTAVTADHANLEARLTPSAGQGCANCAVQVSLSTGADRESIPLALQGGVATGAFTRLESITPAPGDGRLQHMAPDSLVLVWTNPENPLDVVRRSWSYSGLLPTLALFHNGVEIDTVTAAHAALTVRLTLPASEACAGCHVQVQPSGSADRENVAMAGAASAYSGGFSREVGVSPAAGDGRLTHLVGDSIVLIYVNPLTQKQIRRSYPYLDFRNNIGILPHNTFAKLHQNPPIQNGSQWAIGDAAGLAVQPHLAGGGVCCEVFPSVLTAEDSAKFVGLKVLASREFALEMQVFSNLGHLVNKVSFIVPRSEFTKLTSVPGTDVRYLRLLWKGLTLGSQRAGTGAYVFKTKVTLLPVPGVAGVDYSAATINTLGLLRVQ